MCLTIANNSTKPLIAKKDILVWKVITKNNISIWREFRYYPNKTYITKFYIECGNLVYNYNMMFCTVYSGFHAYLSRSIARKVKSYVNDEKVVKFIIPKGAKYYLGDDGDIVSNKIRSGDLKAC